MQPQPQPRNPKLTTRERQILTLLGEGRTIGQVAEDIGVSLTGVQEQLRMAQAKLGARTAVHMVALALSLGEIELWAQSERSA